jgi:hypothetical protein
MERFMEQIQRLSPKHNFTVRERLVILAEYEECLDMGEKSALCRRIGVNQRTVIGWARRKRDGLLIDAGGKQNSHMMKHRERVDYERLKLENEALKAKLAQSESVVEVLGKASALLEALARSAAPIPPAEPVIPAAFVKPKPANSSEPR